MADYIWQLHCQTEGVYHDGDAFPALKTIDDTAPTSTCPVDGGHVVDMVPKNIRIDGSTLLPTSAIDLNEGMLIVPRGTGFPASPAEGQVCYRSDLDEFHAYDGAAWNIVGKGTPHADLTSVTSDQHHARDHASAHSNSDADEVTVENLGTVATDTALILKPNGSGGLVFGSLILGDGTVTVDGEIKFDRTNEDLSIGDGSASQIIHMGVWKTYTPVWTNLTVGNGTSSGRYTQIGKTVHVQISVLLGSTSSIDGAVIVTLPITMASLSGANFALGIVTFLDQGVGYFVGHIGEDSTTSVRVNTLIGNVAFVKLNSLSSTEPFTWTTSDGIQMSITYEAE